MPLLFSVFHYFVDTLIQYRFENYYQSFLQQLLPGYSVGTLNQHSSGLNLLLQEHLVHELHHGNWHCFVGTQSQHNSVLGFLLHVPQVPEDYFVDIEIQHSSEQQSLHHQSVLQSLALVHSYYLVCTEIQNSSEKFLHSNALHYFVGIEIRHSFD